VASDRVQRRTFISKLRFISSCRVYHSEFNCCKGNEILWEDHSQSSDRLLQSIKHSRSPAKEGKEDTADMVPFGVRIHANFVENITGFRDRHS
jgi:hypothetical protein